MDSRLILFDIDQTLVCTDGAGVKALNRALRQVCGADLGQVTPDGMTDPAIVREALAHARVPHERWPAVEQECLELYQGYLAEELAVENPRRHLKPGVAELLEALEAKEWARLGLLTGNLESTGRLKLRALGIERYFPVGGFASDCSDRCRLGGVALERARRRFGIPFEPQHVWVLGDTAHDVKAAHAVGARALAVATGRYPAAHLEEFHPEVVLEDLSDVPAVLEILQN